MVLVRNRPQTGHRLTLARLRVANQMVSAFYTTPDIEIHCSSNAMNKTVTTYSKNLWKCNLNITLPSVDLCWCNVGLLPRRHLCTLFVNANANASDADPAAVFL